MTDKYNQLLDQLADLHTAFQLSNWIIAREIGQMSYDLIKILVRTALASNKPVWRVLTDLVRENVPNSQLSSPHTFRLFVHAMNEHLATSHKFTVELQWILFEYPNHILRCIVELSLLSLGEKSKGYGQVLCKTYDDFDEGLIVTIGPALIIEMFMVTSIKLCSNVDPYEVIGQLAILPLPMPKSDLAKRFQPLFLIKQPSHEYTLGLLSHLSKHFQYGTISISNKSYKVNKTVISMFSSVMASAFINAEIRQDKFVSMDSIYEPYLIEYLKYLANESNTLLDPTKFNDNFTFANAIGDNTLAFRQLDVFFPALETIQLSDVDAIYNRIRTFLLSL